MGVGVHSGLGLGPGDDPAGRHRGRPGPRWRHELVEQASGGLRHLIDGPGEDLLVGPGRGPLAAHLADELKGGRLDFVVRGGFFAPEG